MNPQNVAKESGSVHISWLQSRCLNLITAISTGYSKIRVKNKFYESFKNCHGNRNKLSKSFKAK